MVTSSSSSRGERCAAIARSGVLPTGLGGRAVVALLLALEPGLASPGPLELVLDVDGQLAQPLGLDLDLVAVHERVETAMVGAGGQDVAGFEGVNRGDPLDAAGDLVGHVVGVEVLHQGTVVPELD